ncbi:hypothetical protein VC212_04405 [Xanthomonas sp. WHRI 8932A]|nr:hypothetical protein [Xanthomonas sp. WHRI 8932A]
MTIAAVIALSAAMTLSAAMALPAARAPLHSLHQLQWLDQQHHYLDYISQKIMQSR